MRVSLIQLRSDEHESSATRLERAAALVRAQQGADLVLLPELWLPGGFDHRAWERCAEPLTGPTATALADWARQLGAYLHAGSVVEAAPDGGLYNTSLLYGPDGALLTTYRKIHRFGFATATGEARVFSAGAAVVTCPLPFGEAGLATCYDLRFPELFRLLVGAGATLLLMPSAWPERRIEHWNVLARARAIENQMFVLACNGVGAQPGGVQLGGRSLVVDPWGAVLAEAGPDEQVLTVEIDPALVAKTRAQFPVLSDRRL
jgi:predicted amidohydrolase